MKPSRALFLRRGTQSSMPASSKGASSQSRSSELKPSQGPKSPAQPKPLLQSTPAAVQVKHVEQAQQKQRRHTEGSHAEAAPAANSSSGTQGHGRSGSFSAGSSQALRADEQELQSASARPGSLGRSPSTSAGNRSRSLSANEDSQAPARQWCALHACYSIREFLHQSNAGQRYVIWASRLLSVIQCFDW